MIETIKKYGDVASASASLLTISGCGGWLFYRSLYGSLGVELSEIGVDWTTIVGGSIFLAILSAAITVAIASILDALDVVVTIKGFTYWPILLTIECLVIMVCVLVGFSAMPWTWKFPLSAVGLASLVVATMVSSSLAYLMVSALFPYDVRKPPSDSVVVLRPKAGLIALALSSVFFWVSAIMVALLLSYGFVRNGRAFNLWLVSADRVVINEADSDEPICAIRLGDANGVAVLYLPDESPPDITRIAYAELPDGLKSNSC